jgi:hypothetical protein
MGMAFVKATVRKLGGISGLNPALEKALVFISVYQKSRKGGLKTCP